MLCPADCRIPVAARCWMRRALTGNEEIIYSNLNELTEGESVNTIPIDWTPRD